MKLASIRDGSRDGQLVIVCKDLSKFVPAAGIAPTLQDALDRWETCEQELVELAEKLERGEVRPLSFLEALDCGNVAAPLPRAYEWIDGSAYINHIILVRKARGAEPPETLRTDPLIYQGGSGVLLGPMDQIKLADESWGLDFESEVCVILGDTPQGTKASGAEKAIRLVTIANDVSLRNLIPNELAKGFGFFQSKPATAFAPVAVTPDELGSSWKDGRLHAPLVTTYNDKLFGDPDAGLEMHFSFFDLIEHLCRTRSYTAGTILGSGTVSNEDRSRGSSCLAEVRMIEKIDQGEIRTPFMSAGDRVQIEMFDANGDSIFGRISQVVVKV